MHGGCDPDGRMEPAHGCDRSVPKEKAGKNRNSPRKETSVIPTGEDHTGFKTFNGVYREYSSLVYNVAFRMSGSEETAHDICQEVFLNLYAALPSFRGESLISTWIYRITKNTAIRFLTRARRKDFRTFDALIREHGNNSDGTERDPFELTYYVNQVKSGCLIGLLQCLPFHRRLAFILSVIVELPTREVAEVIERSENATRLLVHRARKSIRNFLCTRCSLYDERNECRCENLINFSLKNDLIRPFEALSGKTEIIERELRRFKDEVLLYRSLPGSSSERIQARIAETEFNIFSGKP